MAGKGWDPTSTRGFPRAVRRQILERDPVCQCDRNCPEHHGQRCAQASTEADHIVQPGQGGPNTIDNGRGLCHRCHVWRTSEQARAGRRTQRRPDEQHPGLLP